MLATVTLLMLTLQPGLAGEASPSAPAHLQAAEGNNAPVQRTALRPVEQSEKPETAAKPEVELLPIEENVVHFTNLERARYGLPPLEVHPQLMRSARAHANWMTLARSLRHTSQPVAENIAMGQPDSQDVVRCWMNSAGHRANILNGGHRFIGVGVFRTEEGRIFWCQQFLR